MGAILLDVELVPLLGRDINAALVLSQILYWYKPGKSGESKLRVRKYGHWWLSKSHKEWTVETGLTRKQVRRALQVLITRGVIATEVFKFDGVPTLHIRLAMTEGRDIPPEGPIDWLRKANSLALEGQSITGGITTGEIQQQKHTAYASFTNAFALDKKPTKIQKVKTSQGEGKGKGKKIVNSKETLQKLVSQKYAAQKPPAKVTAKSLSAFWIANVPKNVEGFVKPHTLKELGVLSHYLKVTGLHAVPAMEWAITHWQAFRNRCKFEMAVDVPSRPSIYYLLKCCAVAVNAYQEKPAPPKKYAPLVQMTAPKKDPKATNEEVLAMLKELKS